MKKFLSLMLAVLMLLSMATVAFADGEGKTTYDASDDQATFTFKKVVQTNYGTAPQDTYHFTISPKKDSTYTVAGPAFTTPSFDITAAAAGGNKVIDLPAASAFPAPGKYLYEVTETAGGLKGMTYDTTYYFVISVFYTTDGSTLIRQVTKMWKIVNDEKVKVDNFTNIYNAGDVSVKKVVATDSESAVANYTYTFNFVLTGLNNPTTDTGRTYYTVSSDNGNAQEITVDENGGASFSVSGLTNDSVVTIHNMPEHATYTVTETAVTVNSNGKETWTRSGEVETAEEIVVSTNTQKTITNTFTHVGDLTISKKVTGAGGDKNKVFEFTLTCPNVVLDGKGKNVTCTGNATITPVEGQNNQYKITMKDSESVTIANLPYKTSYSVVENTYGDYTPNNPENANGSIMNPTTTVEFVNDKGLTPETGVSLDTLPYVLVLALAGAGLVLMIARKRRVED